MTPDPGESPGTASSASRACRAAVVGTAVLLAAIFVAGAGGTTATPLHGTVMAAGRPLANARVTLYAAARRGARSIGHTTTNSAGEFSLVYTAPTAGVIYAEATPSVGSRLMLRSVSGVLGDEGGAPPRTVTRLAVNELTTVAAAYALAQFSDTNGIHGASPGLENAAATAFNLADPEDGAAGAVVSDANNGSKNDTLATLDTLANLVSTCASSSARCTSLLRLATPPGGATPRDTAQALVDIARNPTLSSVGLFALAKGADVYAPVLRAPPTAWLLVLLYTATDLYASGRIALDARGNAWSSTNWEPGTQKPSTSVSVLDAVGRPALGSPIDGGGMKGGAWGIAIAGGGVVWVPSFGGASMVKYSPAGAILSPGDGYTNGGLNHPQGVAVDQKGNVWIANNYGPESAPGQGNVVVYPGGDPAKAVTITGGGLNHPFAIQIDGYGRAWVTNAGLRGAKLVDTRAAIAIGKFGGSVTVIGPDFEPTSSSPVEDDSFKWPLGLAVDSGENAWVVNYFGSTVTEIGPDGTVSGVYRLPRGTLPWSEAVDGSDRVWVAGFGRPGVWLLCGADTAACPPGSATGAVLSPQLGYRSKAFQHFTSIQLDQSGNVWLSNNWSKLVPPVGGTGIAEIVGVATPVCTPLTPLPAMPSAASDDACPQQTAADLPATLAGSSGSTSWWWLAGGAAVLALVAAGAVLLLRRRRLRTS